MTFGPLPAAPGVTRRRSRRVRRQAEDCLALAALWLDYPDEALVARRADLLAAARALPGPAARHLVAFGEWFAARDPEALRVDYVATFDHHRGHALYVTFATAGDTRQRGLALLAFRRLYAEAGFAARADELPDYLPTVLQFAALAPPPAGEEALAMARPGIESIAAALVASGSPWAPLLRAVRACLPPLEPAAERRLAELVAAGPPSEAVGAGWSGSPRDAVGAGWSGAPPEAVGADRSGRWAEPQPVDAGLAPPSLTAVSSGEGSHR